MIKHAIDIIEIKPRHIAIQTMAHLLAMLKFRISIYNRACYGNLCSNAYHAALIDKTMVTKSCSQYIIMHGYQNLSLNMSPFLSMSVATRESDA